MKRLSILLGAAFVIISGCLIYMVSTGIGLRAAPLIRPSEMSADRANVPRAVVHRLFPDFQNAAVVVWGVLPETDVSRTLLNGLIQEYEEAFHRKVSVLLDAANADDATLKACAAPCWMFLNRGDANELSEHPFLERRFKPLGVPYFNLTLVEFTAGVEIPDGCNEEKRLSLRCLVPLVIHESARKMKNPDARYFFLRKYNEKDFFLFLQN